MPSIELEARFPTVTNLHNLSILSIDGSNIKIRYGLLERQICKNVREIDYDILTVIAAVVFADNRLKRRLSERWGRSISLRIPVDSPFQWNSTAIRPYLIECLRILTGDEWNIDFISRTLPLKNREAPFLNFQLSDSIAIIPFSDGLDSSATGQQLSKQYPHLEQLRVTSWHGALFMQQKTKCKDGVHRIPVTISGGGLKHREQSFRTRPFKFLMLSALVAGLTDSNVVYIPENGQGIIGPTLMTKGEEWTYWGSHPRFTSALAKFINAALGFQIEFKHPNLWRTKGEMVNTLLKNGGKWKSTMSCCRDTRQGMKIEGKRVHCGVCSNCLLRRMSLFSAGLGMNPEPYIWPNFNHAKFEDDKINYLDRPITKNDIDIACSSVIGHDALATYAKWEGAEKQIESQAFQIAKAGVCTQEKARRKIVRLLTKHTSEWLMFLDSIDKSSWINSLLSS